VLVIRLPNPIHSALALIGNLVSIAVLYYTLNAPFLMAVQLIVYAGAIVVLFLFVVMLLSSRGEVHARKHLMWLAPAAWIGALLTFLGAFAMIAMDGGRVARPSDAVVVGDPASIGVLLFGKYLLPFEATSILLLAALVGAMYLGRRGESGEVEDYGGAEEANDG
jgi:NADH-quinone oxidoreductase subunit J